MIPARLGTPPSRWRRPSPPRRPRRAPLRLRHPRPVITTGADSPAGRGTRGEGGLGTGTAGTPGTGTPGRRETTNLRETAGCGETGTASRHKAGTDGTPTTRHEAETDGTPASARD